MINKEELDRQQRKNDLAEGLAVWGKVSRPTDNIVRVWLDPELINSKLDLTDYSESDTSGDLANRSAKSNMGNSSAQGKEERKFKLKSLIRSDKIKTLQEAEAIFKTEIEKSTIIAYLYEMNLRLFDEKEDMYVGASQKEADNQLKSDIKESSRNTKYYSADPDKGGKLITKEEYLKAKWAYLANEIEA